MRILKVIDKGCDNIMKNHIIFFVLFLFLLTNPCYATETISKKGKDISLKLSVTLQQELLSAMEKGGAVNAIGVCSEKAFLIAEKISKETGAISVSRISEKYRNPFSKPDDFDMSVINEFKSLKEKNKEYPDFLVKEKPNSYIYYKTIIIGDLCLKCHGEKDKIEPDVLKNIYSIYPDDKARGYKKGDFRGLIRVEIDKKSF